MLRAASLAALSLVAALVVACGGGAASGDADPASAVPADAMVYAEIAVRPEGNLREDVLAAAGKVLRTEDPEGKMRELLDKALAEQDQTNLDYDKDIKPWLGERAAFWFNDRLDDEGTPGGAAIVAVTDTEAAIAAIRKASRDAGDRLTKRSHAGVDYEVDQDGVAAGTVEDFLIVGQEAEFKRTIDAQKGDSLGESDRYRAGVDELEDERLAHFYLDLKRAFRMASQESPDDEDLRQLQALLPIDRLPPLVGSFVANGDRLALDAAIKGEGLGQLGALGGWTTSGTPLLQELPGDSWAAFGSAKYGQTFKAVFDQYAGALGGAAAKQQLRDQFGIDLDRDLLSWIGDVAVFVRGDTMQSLDGGLVIDVTDEGKAKTGFGKLVGLLQSAGGVSAKPVSIDGAETAFAVEDASIPKPIILARSSERVVVAYGQEAAKQAFSPDSKLGDSDLYEQTKESLGDIEPGLLVSMPTVISLVDSSGSADASFEQARPYLEAYDVVGYGAEGDRNGGRVRFAAGLK
jgi:hypothetical protein